MLIIKLYVLTLLPFLVLDGIWLGTVARGFYASQLGSLLRPNINYLVAGSFYLTYVGGLVFFAVAPALAGDSVQIALLNGSLLGLVAYATYNMTNLATLRNWPLLMSAVDTVWGVALTAVSASVGMLVTRTLS